MMARAIELLPALNDAEIIAHGVGLRSVRNPIRLDAMTIGNKLVVNNYGHRGGRTYPQLGVRC